MRAKINSSKIEIGDITPVLLIVGDGRSMTADLEAFNTLCIDCDISAIGRSIKHQNNARHWFNADGETAIAWAKQLKVENPELITHTLGEVDGFDVDWDIEQPDYHYQEITGEAGRLHGSSALFATLAAIALGYEKIVLTGCPLDAEGHWYFAPTKETLGPIWLGLDFMAWLDFANTPDTAKVRSMSGYTQKILGTPERSWLNV